MEDLRCMDGGNLEPIVVYSRTIKTLWDWVISDVQDLWGKEGKEGEGGQEEKEGRGRRISLSIYLSLKSHMLVLIMSQPGQSRVATTKRRTQPSLTWRLVDPSPCPTCRLVDPSSCLTCRQVYPSSCLTWRLVDMRLASASTSRKLTNRKWVTAGSIFGSDNSTPTKQSNRRFSQAFFSKILFVR